MRLTAKERILLYLVEASPRPEAVEASPAGTQESVARGAGIEVRHVPQYVRPLIHDGLVRERQAHVQGIRQRRKVVDLTDAGRRVAIQLRERARAEVVRVRDDSGIQEMTVSEALRLAGGSASLLDVIRESADSGVVEMARIGAALPRAWVALLTGAPRVEAFVGRAREMEALTGDTKGARIIVIRGVAGIGKSSLAAKACELLGTERNLYWHRVRPWDTSLSILAGLAHFLSRLGRPGLSSVLGRGEVGRAADVLRQDLAGTRSFLVFDDAHEASPEALGAFSALKDAVAQADDVRVLFLTRRALSFYDRRDVDLRGPIREMDLEGLDASEVAAWLGSGERGPQIAHLARPFAGHPLILELLRSGDAPTSDVSRLTNARRFIEEAIYAGLSDPERKMLKIAALYRTPVPQGALFGSPDLTYDVLLDLRERALIRGVGEDAFEVHDTIRDYCDSILSAGERAVLNPFAVGQLQALASRAEQSGDYLACVDCLANAARLAGEAGDRVALLESLGDAHERIGNLPETLNAYKEGLALTEDPSEAARLHRKTARALADRGDTNAESVEVAEGFRALDTTPSVERGWLLLLRGDIFTDREDWDPARSCFQDALAVFRSFGERRGEVEALMLLANQRIHEPEPDDAEGERMFQAGFKLASSLGDRKLLSEVHGDLAHFYAIHRPDAEKALAHAVAQASAAGEQDSYAHLAAAWWKAQALAEIQADFTGAEASLRDMESLAHRTYNTEGSYLARYGLASVAYFRGAYAEARRQHEGLWHERQAPGRAEFTWASEFAFESLWTAAECCLREADREGFERLAAEAERPEVQARIPPRLVVADILRGLSGLIRGDDARFESSFSRALGTAERAFQSGEAPTLFLTYLVPYFYGMGLRAQGRQAEAGPYVSRALDTLLGAKLRARRDALLGGQDRFVEVLREWVAPTAQR